MTDDEIIQRALAGDPAIAASIEKEFEKRPPEDADAVLSRLSFELLRVAAAQQQVVVALTRAAAWRRMPARDPDPEIDAIVDDVARTLAALGSAEGPDSPEFLRVVEQVASAASGYLPERVQQLVAGLVSVAERGAALKARMISFNEALARDARFIEAIERLHQHRMRLDAKNETRALSTGARKS